MLGRCWGDSFVIPAIQGETLKNIKNMEVKKYQYYAGGVWRDAENARTFDDLEPYSGKIYAKIAAGSREDMKFAIDAAAAAFPAWAATTPSERADLLLTQPPLSSEERQRSPKRLQKRQEVPFHLRLFKENCLLLHWRKVQPGRMKIKGKCCNPMFPDRFP